MARQLTDAERDTFGAILGAEGIALVQTTFDGIETAIIAVITEPDDSGQGGMWPLAVLVTDEMFDRIAPPDPSFTPVSGNRERS